MNRGVGKIVLAAMGVALSLMAVTSAFSAAAAIKADTVYVNGIVYTVDDKNPKVSAMAIKGDRFLFVGV